MASETATASSIETDAVAGNWKAGVTGGLIGSAVFGVMLTLQMTNVIEIAIPSMYGLAPPASGLAGWFVHMSHGAVLGVAFAGFVGAVGLDGESAQKQVGAGLAYGIVLWVVLAAVVMPIWLSTVGSPASPPLPNFNPQSLIGHAIYGAVLGATYYALEDL
ncbi:MAG: hypothetical protein ACI8UR_000939 [Natronomonas sp.]|jgi:hypothetical protein|uniref:DUF6789 family protein n=1 Tax=Natronomonas sp. TaxID=2184060 RepID=UPI00398922F4